ncbi:proline--tRNA ligase [Guyparkeria hydrothermalis]|uniref:proline--tRNA ligase n=1 Tax=Guyparkeria hydrothermalis TaxID=923 RepID=UPI002021C6D2|nr:proline--tRNA ligase [Guyparkeria hydrothermalis]MCL7752037.1 proline--tRNA ligase [Guyparkeria hydrothermalis]
MRASQFAINTMKETPAEAEIVSHQLMLRAGMLKKLASGLYTWSPLGLKVLRRVEAIVREEMDAAGALELLMPAVQPAELWEESGRWQQYGPELLRLTDRHGRDFCFGPTHEEVITDYARRELKSYRQLPVNFYQIQTKFRDEIRPRFGVMRAREFVMKDAYSFHADAESLEQTYQLMYTAYSRILERMGLAWRAVVADTGSIGGNASHEFHVLADSGEDAIAYAVDGDYAANVEMAPTFPADGPRAEPAEAMSEVATPNARTIDDVASTLDVPATRTVKTLLVQGTEVPAVALVLRGDHALNEIKATKQPAIAEPLTFVDEAEAPKLTGASVGSIGPVGLDIPVIVDHAAAALSDFVCGANKDGYHLTGVNWGRDLPEPETADLRDAVAGDPAPNGQGKLDICRGIEVGHVFQLGDKYSRAMNCEVLGEDGKPITPLMGCYGIGVSRIVAAAIEQNFDERGIRWPQPIAPFTVAIVPIGANKDETVMERAEAIYADLRARGIEVILDDRGLRPGAAFADWELIGIPLRIVVSPRGLAAGQLEVRRRDADASEDIAAEQLFDWLDAQLA